MGNQGEFVYEVEPKLAYYIVECQLLDCFDWEMWEGLTNAEQMFLLKTSIFLYSLIYIKKSNL